jgi:hypothetical protein
MWIAQQKAGARMFGFLTPVGNEASDPLADPESVEAFWRTVPRDDPIAAQKAVCAALADWVARGNQNVDRLRAVLMLDRRARVLIDALLAGGVAANVQTVSAETRSLQGAFELCSSFGQAHGQALRLMRDNPAFQDSREYHAHVVLRLFHHRRVELLLRPFVDEGATRFSWKEVHAAYRFAQSRGLLHDDISIHRDRSSSAEKTSLEREYAHLLMQGLTNGGNLSPQDALWMNRGIPRWCHALVLESHEARASNADFVVDPNGDTGLVRPSGETTDTSLCVDLAPVVERVRAEIASLRDGRGHSSRGPSMGRGRQMRILAKLLELCAPARPEIARRGERRPTALTVEVALGTSQVLSALRNSPDHAAASLASTSDGATIPGFDASSEDSGVCAHGAIGVTERSSAKTSHAVLTMVDRSNSGCRLHGPALVANPTTPGALIAFRESAGSPWMLAVVRRVRKRLAGKRVEIGVEYLGTDPRWVVVAVDSDASSGETPHTPSRFAALYLAESAKQPMMPIKTLILPILGLLPGDRLSVRSRTSVHTIQLKEPLEEQADFVWSPFELVDRPKSERVSEDAVSLTP